MSVLQKVNAKKLSLLALMLLLIYPVAIIAARLELTHFRNSFLIFIVAAIVGFIALVLAILKLSQGDDRETRPLLVVLLATLLPLSIMGTHVYKAQSHPFIHDISTDLVNPPQLQAAAKVRLATDHKVEYATADIAQIQMDAYPDIKALVLNLDAQAVFSAAQLLIEKNGWELLASNQQALPYTLEATQSSVLFGFSDDIVVRIKAVEAGENTQTQVDMRSMSRVGKSDMGMNAQRIQAFLTDLQLSLK